EKRNDGGGVSVVVGGRESRSHGEGKQGVDRLSKPEERSVDTDQQADQAWLLGVQRKLYQWSRTNPNEPYRDLWNWLTDIRNLRCAWRRVAQNKGRQTPGIDGKTVRSIRRKLGEATYLNELQSELGLGRYRPSPCTESLFQNRANRGNSDPWGFRRFHHTTTSSNTDIESLVVTHPFHPLTGQRLPILFERRYKSAAGKVC